VVRGGTPRASKKTKRTRVPPIGKMSSYAGAKVPKVDLGPKNGEALSKGSPQKIGCGKNDRGEKKAAKLQH